MRNRRIVPAGVFLLRTDTTLKQRGCEDWDFQKICFLWYSWEKRYINDSFIFIPDFLFEPFRAALYKPLEPQCMHWLNQVAVLRDHMFVEFDVNHPTNSATNGNTRYKIEGREEGPVSEGKWRELVLQKKQQEEGTSDGTAISDAQRALSLIHI